MEQAKEEAFDVKGFAIQIKREIEKNRVKLPTLPAISLEALLIVNDAGSSMADVARIIVKDTSMAARVVRYANSPLYRGVNNVTTVKGAITRIGIDAVKNAILSLAMRDVFTTSYKPIQQRMELLWQHSVAVAAKATLLSEQFRHLDRDEAMLAGLIHDVGAIPILINARDHDVLLKDEAKLDKLVQTLHMNVGKFMLDQWNFDSKLVEVAATHDKLDRVPHGPEVDYVDVVQVANVLSYESTDHPYAHMEQSDIPAFNRVGLDRIAQLQAQAADGTESELQSALG